MNPKKKTLTALTLILIISAVTFFLFYYLFNDKAAVTHVPAEESTQVSVKTSHGDAPKEVMVYPEQANKLCHGLRGQYQNINEVKKNQHHSMRFVNIHKKVDGSAYRLRFFYKEGNESDIPTYLLYKEDQNENEYIIEKKAYKKGAQYKKIENAQGDITYTEEGITLGKNQELFLHYVDDKLEMIQGSFLRDKDLSPASDLVDCKF